MVFAESLTRYLRTAWHHIIEDDEENVIIWGCFGGAEVEH